MEREEAVLKLVHPGRFVEIHHHPVAASEVMAKNPRHFVTRPDVFRFPWIVVRPDSLLKPGNIFYIVPFHTLYRLLQSYRRRKCRSPPRISPHYESLRPPPIDPWAADAAVLYSNIEVVDGGDGGRHEGEATGERKLKSCLKKGSSTTTPRGRRVMFVLPSDEVETADGDVDNDDGERIMQGFACDTASNFFGSSSCM